LTKPKAGDIIQCTWYGKPEYYFILETSEHDLIMEAWNIEHKYRCGIDLDDFHSCVILSGHTKKKLV
jgi:hypothetical protein